MVADKDKDDGFVSILRTFPLRKIVGRINSLVG
jgi:hypothetical protein